MNPRSKHHGKLAHVTPNPQSQTHCHLLDPKVKHQQLHHPLQPLLLMNPHDPSRPLSKHLLTHSTRLAVALEGASALPQSLPYKYVQLLP